MLFSTFSVLQSQFKKGLCYSLEHLFFYEIVFKILIFLGYLKYELLGFGILKSSYILVYVQHKHIPRDYVQEISM